MAAPNVVTSPQNSAVMAPWSALPNNPPAVQGAQALRLLSVAKGVNLNATGDQAILNIINSSAYSVLYVILTNASISLTTAAAGLFTAPSAGGTAIVANAALSGATGPTIVSQRTVASTAVQTSQQLYLNVGTAQGAPATGDIYVIGFDLSA